MHALDATEMEIDDLMLAGLLSDCPDFPDADSNNPFTLWMETPLPQLENQNFNIASVSRPQKRTASSAARHSSRNRSDSKAQILALRQQHQVVESQYSLVTEENKKLRMREHVLKQLLDCMDEIDQVLESRNIRSNRVYRMDKMSTEQACSCAAILDEWQGSMATVQRALVNAELTQTKDSINLLQQVFQSHHDFMLNRWPQDPNSVSVLLALNLSQAMATLNVTEEEHWMGVVRAIAMSPDQHQQLELAYNTLFSSLKPLNTFQPTMTPLHLQPTEPASLFSQLSTELTTQISLKLAATTTSELFASVCAANEANTSSHPAPSLVPASADAPLPTLRRKASPTRLRTRSTLHTSPPATHPSPSRLLPSSSSTASLSSPSSSLSHFSFTQSLSDAMPDLDTHFHPIDLQAQPNAAYYLPHSPPLTSAHSNPHDLDPFSFPPNHSQPFGTPQQQTFHHQLLSETALDPTPTEQLLNRALSRLATFDYRALVLAQFLYTRLLTTLQSARAHVQALPIVANPVPLCTAALVLTKQL